MAEERERDYVWLAPGLIVECLSPSNRKSSVLQLLADYEKARTSEVWLIYPEQRRLAIYMRRGTALEHISDTSSGTIRPKLCPADVNVDDLWSAFERP